MRVVVAGGHGQIALLLHRLLHDSGHVPVGLIRDPSQAADVTAAGGDPVLLDLEHATVDDVAEVLAGADAAVFAAGSGGRGPAERTRTVDRDGAVLLATAAEVAGVRRFVLLSAAGTDGFDAGSDDRFQLYLRAKSEADADVRGRDLDWTVLRPDGLTDTPGTGLVTVGETTPRHSIPRADVAAVIASLLTDGTAVRRQFEVTGGGRPIAEALATL